MPTFRLLALALACAACSSVLPAAESDIQLTLPSGNIGAGSVLEVAIENHSDHQVTAGPLPCTVHLAKRVGEQWDVMPSLILCPNVMTEIAPGARVTLSVLMPSDLGAYRLQTDVVRGNDDEGIRVVSRTFAVLGIAVEF